MIMIRAMLIAMRSVFLALCLLVLIIYIFAVTFTQISVDTRVGVRYFNNVPESMNTLLLHGCFGENLPDLMDEAYKSGVIYGCALLAFVFLASLTVMNMLIGVLCEVVKVVSAVEKEQL